MKKVILSLFIALSALLLSGKVAFTQTLNPVGMFDSGVGEGTEVISVQASTARAALTNSATGTISILDLSDPADPVLAAVYNLNLGSGEGVTSVAFHPTGDYFIVAIEVESAVHNGRAEIRSASTGAIINTLATGSEPDAVAIDKQGRRAVVSNEGESFDLNADGEFFSPPGSVTIIDLRDGPAAATVTHVALPDATGTPGMVNEADNRFLERGVDLNGDGEIADEFEDGEGGFDENGNGVIEDIDFLAGTIDGIAVWGNEEAGELVMIPVLDSTPRYLEPEIGAFSSNGKTAFIAMQENNGMAVIDVIDGSFVGYFGLGITIHAADKTEDGFIDFSETLIALREPDGVAITPDGQYLVTADEGDTDPKASKTDDGFSTAGGRTVTVYDAATGTVLGDTGNQLDLAAANAGMYPDKRSDSKGAEPENLVTFRYRGITYAAVGMERADTVALVSLENPENPAVVSLAAVNPGTELSSQAPEGIAVFKAPDGSHFIYTANEKSGVVSVFEVMPF